MSVYVTETFTVEIVDDRPRVLAFLQWICDSQVLPIRGTGSSGPDWTFHTFEAGARGKIDRFFADYDLRRAALGPARRAAL